MNKKESNRVKKRRLKVEFGWKHYIGDKFVQIKKGRGGGNRKLDMERIATYQDCLSKAKEHFFADSSSQYGTLSEMETPYLANNKLDKINEEGFTVERYKKRTRMNLPRLYLVTKPKTQADSSK